MDNFNRKNTHLTFDVRLEIQQCLNCEMTFKDIAKHIGKDQTTISKEIKRNLFVKLTDITGTDKNGNTILLSSI